MADSGGKFAAIYFDASLAYRVVIKNSAESVTLHDIDPVNSGVISALSQNTGAASIFIMLDEYIKTQPVKVGDRLLLFVPESGQFNYVLISLTVV